MSNEQINRVHMEVVDVPFWDCGKEFRANGIFVDGKPMFKRRFVHQDTYLEFDSRCAVCQIERRLAKNESLLLEAWHQSREQMKG